MLNIDIIDGLNVSNIGDKFSKLVSPEAAQNKTAVFNYSSTSETNSEVIGSFTEDGHLKTFSCSKTVFNLSKKVLAEAEIKVLEKGLHFAPIQNTLFEPELRKDFEEFSRRMRCQWNFRNELNNNFSEIPAFRPKSGWKPPKGLASLQVLLSREEIDSTSR